MTVQQCECGAVIDHEECACSIRDTDCIQVDGSGSVLNPLRPEFVLDTDDDNLATCESDGVLVKLPTWMTNPDRCQVTHSTNQSIAHYTDETVAFDSENYDTATPKMHSTSTDNERITIQTSGIYIITFVVAFVANATGGRQATIIKNGKETIAAVHHTAPSASFEAALNVTAHEWLQEGDYITATVKHYRGSALAIVGGTSYSPVLTVQFRRLPPNE